jgi:hypothetical protein
MAMAIEFFGASVSDIDAPASYMKWGIIGPRPIVTSVLPNSPAELAGFGRGNLILSVNGTTIGSSSELGQFSADRLAVLVFSGEDQITRTIDRFAYEAAQASRANDNSGGAVAPPPPSPAEPAVIQPDNSPAIVLDNATIDAVYGATTPQQRAIEAQRAEQIRLENERVLRLQQDRDLQRRSTEVEQARQRQDAERRVQEETRERSDELRRDQERRDVERRDGGMERGRR